MKRILKYKLTIGENQIQVRQGGIVRHVATLRDTPCMWIEGDDELPYELRTFVVHGTMHGIPGNEQYLGTFMFNTTWGYPFVRHLFEVPPMTMKRRVFTGWQRERGRDDTPRH